MREPRGKTRSILYLAFHTDRNGEIAMYSKQKKTRRIVIDIFFSESLSLFLQSKLLEMKFKSDREYERKTIRLQDLQKSNHKVYFFSEYFISEHVRVSTTSFLPPTNGELCIRYSSLTIMNK